METFGIILVSLLIITFILTAKVVSSYRKAKTVGDLQYKLQLLKLNEIYKK